MTAEPSAQRPPEAQLLRVEDAADLLAIGRTKVFDLIRSGQLESVKLGRSRRLSLSAVIAFIDSQSERAD